MSQSWFHGTYTEAEEKYRMECFFVVSHPKTERNQKLLQFEDEVEWYGFFLEDGDFEKFQPCCYVEVGQEEYQLSKKEAFALVLDESLDHSSFEYRRKKYRILWIQLRFFKWGGWDWILRSTDMNTLLESFTEEERLVQWWNHSTT